MTRYSTQNDASLGQIWAENDGDFVSPNCEVQRMIQEMIRILPEKSIDFPIRGIFLRIFCQADILFIISGGYLIVAQIIDT